MPSKTPPKRRSKSKGKGTPKFKTVYMVTDAIFTLNDRKGSSREAIWKYVSHHKKYQESIKNKKLFLTQLRRLS